MKVDIVSGIGFRNSNINFGERKRVHEGAPVSKPSGVSDLAKVPVIVLLAMNPATLNSAIPTMPETDNPNKITILAPETKSSDAATYVISPETEDEIPVIAPYGWGYLKYGKIYQISKVKVDGKYNRDLVFYTPISKKKDVNGVAEVLIVNPNKQGSPRTIPHPPKIEKIIYHDLGKDREFCSVKTIEYLLDDSRNPIGYAYRELRIDDDSANRILQLLVDESDFKNETKIEYVSTKRTDLEKPTFEYFKN